jgi:sigma-B regulation protein RsbU (phosphoserine phosphatase)
MSTSQESAQILRLEQENQRLRRALEELAVLNEIATAISSTLTLDQIVDLMVQKSVKHLKVEQAAVMLLDEQKQENPFQTMVRRADSSNEILPFRLNTQLTGWMLKHQKPLLVNDFQNDDRFKGLAGVDFSIRSLLSVPLISKGRMIGIINVFNKKAEEGFTSEDQRLLSIIGTQSAQVLENARLLEEEKTLMVMQEEMRMATEIQINLLPKEQPLCSGYDIAGKSIPAKEVGGDYYDFIQIAGNKNCLAFCLGDVTGKGLPAAMLMSNIQATIRNQTLVENPPNDCMKHANTLMFHSTGLGKFITLFYGILDTQQHTLTYSNAGHDSPFLFSDSAEPTRLEIGGVVLGFVPQYSYSEETIPINPGSRLVLYSDGITEAKNELDEEFGEERLQRVITENCTLSSEELIDKIIASVKEYAGKTPQGDDMTIVIVTRK